MKLPGYQIIGELWRGERLLVHRARREADGAAVLLKGPVRQPASPAQLAALQRELALRAELTLPGVLRAYEVIRHDGGAWLVTEDKGGVPLARLLAGAPVDLGMFFHLAGKLTTILGELHRRDIIHKNIHPGPVLVHPVTREVWLDGFSYASRGAGEMQAPVAPALVSGVLAYASPEQTGRMNRGIDYRSDFYSLGATFYELLTGRRPFASTDPLELIHAHIAMTPVPPAEVSPAVPEVVSRIVMKLLAKTADARYQSARGLRADLDVCAREWSAHGAIAPFPLGENDVSDRFLIPGHLYGREREVAELTAAFERACAGPSSLTLVSGYSGVGKTSLIQELYRPIVRQRGYCIAGKFDQVVRDIPYGAIVQAFRGLVQQLLTESEERLAAWRERLTTVLGGNAAVLAEVIPEIELILGPQPPAAPLAPSETQNRFRLVFQSFVGALARREHPLVVLLDDLQWADAASLALLQPLLTSPDVRFLCVIGSYRDNEVDASHLLARSVAALEAAGAHVGRILLGPLDLPELTRLVGDCLRRHDPDIGALARLVAAKTEGNPFFVIQFLKTLWQERLLEFDDERGRWTFRTDDIARAPMTNNVIDLMSHKIGRLSSRTQSVLTLAACIGNPFDETTLALVSRQSPDETRPLIAEAVAEGLVISAPGGDQSMYAFLHDRVQQAAYARLPEDSRPGVHLAVGRLLLSRWDSAGGDDRVFDVVGHLNLGRPLIGDPDERLAVARLNLTAGRRAKSSTAYAAALGYFLAGLALLPESSWDFEYELRFELEREAAECHSLCGNADEAERRFIALLRRARTGYDRAQVYDLRVIHYENLTRFADAARIGTEGLGLFGFVFPDDEDGKRAALAAELAAIETLRAGRSIASLVDLPVMEDRETRLVMRLLTDLWAPAYIAVGAYLPAVVSARMIRLSLEHGNTEDSAFGYVTHAITAGSRLGDYRAAYEWGTLALRVNERFGDLKLRAKVHQQFNAHVTLWRRPFASCIVHAREACRSGLQTGDFAYAGYAAMSEAWPAFLLSRDLDGFVREYVPNLTILERIRTTGLADAHRLILAWARALQGKTAGPLSLSDAGFDEDEFVAAYRDNALSMTLFHVAKLHLALHAEDHELAVAALRDARLQRAWGAGTIWPVLVEAWGGLALAAARDDIHPELLAARDALAVLAENCPENFRCWFLLLTAEIARLDGRAPDAFDRYDEAIAWARQTDSIQHEALARELCGRLWLRRGNDTAALAYLGDARRLYRDWGAAAKVDQLDRKYPQLRATADEPAGSSVDVTSVIKAARALSVEIVLPELLRKLMSIAIENAGAERGVFLEDQDGRLAVAAEGSVHGASVLPPVPLEASAGVAAAVVQYVRKTGESVVLGDAAADQRFAADPYIRAARPRSILCLPVVHQGKFGGILYLENNLTTDAFTADRIEVLEVLSAQAAISLENARLYREKTEEVERRRRAEEELRAALAEVETLKNRLEAENVYLQEEIRNEHNFEEMVGTSPPLLHLLRTIERIAPTDSSVLITGETGSGKELVARAIHDRSPRGGRPLVKVNCGAIAAGLVESELFGHVKGAFTGALEKRVGRFELAQGGTIFLDEIGEIPLETQVKLLRVLQEQEFEPVGSSRTLRIDVRVIAATNRDLDEAVRAGKFRSDLYYRLNVLPVTVPSLRDRRADIPQLVAFFLQRFSRRFSKPVVGVAKETMELLLSYPWPGNIRELQNIIERAVVLSTGPTLTLDRDLRPAVARGRGERVDAAPAPPASGATLEEVERRHILEVLARTHGVIEGPAGAARILQMHPNTLRSRMKKLGIQRSATGAV